MWRSSGLVARVVVETENLGQAASSFSLGHVVSRTARIRLIYLIPLEWVQGLVRRFVYCELSNYENYGHGIRYLHYGSLISHISMDQAIRSADNTAHSAKTDNAD